MSTPQNDAFRILAPKPIDSRYLKNEITEWTSVAEVNAAIPSAYRHKGLTVHIAGVEYWYLGGTTDGHLVPKTTTGIELQLASNGFYTVPYRMLIVAFVVTPNIDINFKAGSSAGAEDFVPQLLLAANQTIPIAVFLWRNAGQTIHFSGITGSNTTIIIKNI